MATILVVDDDQQVRLLLSSFLGTELGHDVVFATDGTSGAAGYARFEPDLVVTDLVMPHLSGVQLIKHLVHTYPGSKVIAISGKGLEELAKAKAAGAVAVLEKPLDRDRLALVIDKALGGEPDAWTREQ